MKEKRRGRGRGRERKEEEITKTRDTGCIKILIFFSSGCVFDCLLIPSFIICKMSIIIVFSFQIGNISDNAYST